MKHDSMGQISNAETDELISLGKKLGLTREDIAAMLRDMPAKTEQTTFDLGPGPYNGGYYGTISINDFKS